MRALPAAPGVVHELFAGVGGAGEAAVICSNSESSVGGADEDSIICARIATSTLCSDV